MKKTKPPIDRLGPSIVDDVRAIRQAIDNEVGHDIDKLAERARLAGERFQAAINAGEIQKPAGPARSRHAAKRARTTRRTKRTS
jgi:hypothetical protein